MLGVQDTRRVRIASHNVKVLQGGDYVVADSFTDSNAKTIQVKTVVSATAGDVLAISPPFKEVQGLSFQWTHEISKDGISVPYLSSKFPMDTGTFTFTEARFDSTALAIVDPLEPLGKLVFEEWTAKGFSRIRTKTEDSEPYTFRFGVDADGSGSITDAEWTDIQASPEGTSLQAGSPSFTSRVKEAAFVVTVQVTVQDIEKNAAVTATGTWVFGEDFPKEATIKPDWSKIILAGVRFQTETSETAYVLPNPFHEISAVSTPGNVNSRELIVWDPNEAVLTVPE